MHAAASVPFMINNVNRVLSKSAVLQSFSVAEGIANFRLSSSINRDANIGTSC